ncbi:hypothetical protein BGW36DRAFT_425112 [Talaromyces proteolyticus]|uniref:Uncharacterized protein n=1 Tax=Talaromyces proteolyticus TaxID=1131652 RepID=A0AAD4Q2B6_9EURO|nr:uncharacterized protein BGW36DRAFT_425112 [Talaromyces proteolyticus]KAH8700282.1 hypothetical protein BGW36DRAFT_425112 [Talaromyces proteolyticus]
MLGSTSQPSSGDSGFPSLETPRVLNASALSITALSRFEFEAGKGNEGTKILMVEWEDDDSRSPQGSWHVSWEGKTSVLPADEQTSENTRRFYFLLPPGVTIPPVISLSYVQPPSSAATVKQPESIQINPLPAIFPPELGATARTAGKKGVLHTIWAKKRLQALEKEIKDESMNNAEGIALQMAIQEKEWIEANFGVSIVPSTLDLSSISPAASSSSFPSLTPISPTSGTRLGEKLKGLKLETSKRDLGKWVEGHDNHPESDGQSHPLSPESSDIAVSSFNAFRTTSVPVADGRRMVAHQPPSYIQKAQNNNSEIPFMDPVTRTRSTDSGDGLFAKALSPRTPDLPRSPFSFSPTEPIVCIEK